MTDGPAAVDPFAGVNVRTLTERLCQASAQKAVIGELADRLRDALLDKALERWREDGTAPTFRAPGLGIVSLTVPQSKVVVDEVDEFACWVVDNHPTEVAGSIAITGVPPARLAEILDAVRDMVPLAAEEGIKIQAGLSVSGPYSKRLLEGDVAVAEAGGATQVIDTTTGTVVLGVKVVPGADPAKPDGPQPTSISVRLDPQAKADAAAQAEVRLAPFLAGDVAGDLIDQLMAMPVTAADRTGVLPGDPEPWPDAPYSADQVVAAAEEAGAQLDVDDAHGEPNEERLCRCEHAPGKHGGKTGAGACREEGCACRRFQLMRVSAWS